MKIVLLIGTVAGAFCFGTALAPSASIAVTRPAPTENYQAVFAECVVRRDLDLARRFVIGSGAPPIDTRCLDSQTAGVTFLEPTYRYLLARALVKRDYSGGPPEGLSSVGEVASAPLSERDRQDPEASQRKVLADCVVRRAPAESYALTIPQAGEPGVGDYIEALAPALAACASTAHVRYPLGFQMQEAIVTRLYQLAYAVRKPSDA